MKVSQRLKELRNEKGLTQAQLGEAVRIKYGYELSQQRIHHYESGASDPDTGTLCVFADFFEVSVDYLVGHGNIRTPLKEFAEYKLNPKEKAIVDLVRARPPEYGDALLQLLEIADGTK